MFLKPKRKQKSGNKTYESIHMKTVGELREQEIDCREVKISFSKQGTRKSLGWQNWSEKENVFSRENECLKLSLKSFIKCEREQFFKKIIILFKN